MDELMDLETAGWLLEALFDTRLGQRPWNDAINIIYNIWCGALQDVSLMQVCKNVALC